MSGMLGNAKELNARDQLQKVAVAETALQAGGEVAAAGAKPVGDGGLVFTGSGSYLNWKVTKDGVITGDKTAAGKYLNEAAAVGFTPADGVATEVVANDTGWVAGSLSPSGKQYWMSSQQSTIYSDSIPTGKYDASLTAPTLVTPYNAAADCTQFPYSLAYVNDSATGNTAVMTKVDDTHVQITLTATGKQLCDWATVWPLNLSGDTVQGTASGDVRAYLSVFNSPSAGAARTNVSLGTTIITTSDTALAATRTITQAFTLPSPWPYASTDEFVSNWNANGGATEFRKTTDKIRGLEMSHRGVNGG